MTNWSNSDRRAFLNGLNRIEQVLVSVGRLFIGLLIAAILAGAVFVFVKRPWGAGNQGEWFYFGVAVLLALGWCVGQFTSLGARRRRRDGDGSMFVLNSEVVEGGQRWTFQFGSPAANSEPTPEGGNDGLLNFSQGFQVPLATLARDVLPDEHSLARLREELALGTSLDQACRSVQPAYGTWNGLQRRAFQLCVTSLLEQGALERTTASCKITYGRGPV
jgi:hypothetical protein